MDTMISREGKEINVPTLMPAMGAGNEPGQSEATEDKARPLKIGEVQADAYEVIYKARVDGRTAYVFDTYIQMQGGQALQVYFEVPEARYSKLREQHPDVVRSIRLSTTSPQW
jgi:hypothetical protein